MTNREQLWTLDQYEFPEGLKPVVVPLKFEKRLGLQEVQPERENLMPVLCMLKSDSKGPRCAVHNVPLKEDQIAIDSNAPQLGRITCYVCPISQSVVNEEKGYQCAKMSLSRFSLPLSA